MIPLKVVIIGGGLSGLGAGYKLSQKGLHVTVLEKEEYVGGMASSYLIDGYYIPKTYHHIMSGDGTTLGLIRELGLQPYLYWKRLKTAFLYGKNLHDFSSPLSILRFKPLAFIDRIRFGLLVLAARRRKDWSFLDSVNVKDWVSKNYSENLYENLIKHIVMDKFDEPPENISAAWLMSRFGHESRSISGSFGYIRNGGIQRIIDRLVGQIEKNGGEVRHTEVKKIEVENGEVKGIRCGEDGEFIDADVAISTIPIPVLLKIVKEFPKTLRERLEKIRYKACICITLGLKKKVSNYYWTNVIGDYPFVGIFEHRHLNTDPSPKGIMYIVKYLNIDHPDWARPSCEIMEHYLDALEEIFPNVKEEILWFRIFREPYSTPVCCVNFGQYKPELRSPIQNLYITGISRIYPRDRYMGTALNSGFEAAEAAMQDNKIL